MRRPDVSASLCFRSLSAFGFGPLVAPCSCPLHPAFLPRWAQLCVGGRDLGVFLHSVDTSLQPLFHRALRWLGGGCLSPSGGRPGVTSTLYPSYSLVLSPAITGEGYSGRSRA